MGYIELLEQGGLDAVNARVQSLFEQLKQTPGDKELGQAIKDFNDLLYRAIECLVPAVKAISITFSELQDNDKAGAYYYLPEAYNQNSLTFDGSLHIHLPYIFSPTQLQGKHAGSGFRQLQALESRTLEASKCFEKVSLDFNVFGSLNLLGLGKSSLPLERIISINFTDKEEYSHHFTGFPNDYTLTSAPTFFEYYKIFEENRKPSETLI